MPAQRYFQYATEAEARAFIDGMHFVNDSAIELKGIFAIPETAGDLPRSGCFAIHLTDWDKDEAESDEVPESMGDAGMRPLSLD